jgi:hypothetical protein
MATAKTATLSLRIETGLKEALRTAAEREHRSLADMVEVMIRAYCGRAAVTITEPGGNDSRRKTAKGRQ